MKKLLSALAALTLASFLPATADTPVAGAGSDLKPDPKALFGHMDNGFRYIIYPNSEPPARFSIRLHIAAGSLHEEDDQRGLAHFLEHMVFNGSKNFSPDELIPRMQRLGIAFGAHANAYTSFDETVYMLDLPNLKDDTLDLTFTVMRDFADGALLAADEIEKERGVILSEKTSRDSVDYRMMVKQYGYLLPGSRIFNRLPIGTEEVIKKAPRQRFLDFYEHYYTPERMTLVLVGDFDAHEMEKRVRETFISLANPEKPGANPPADRAPAGHGLRTEIFTDPEISSDDLTLYTLRDYEQEADTAANRQAKLPLALAHSILSRRLEILAKKENTPFIDGSAGRFILFNQIETGYLSLTPAEGQWQAALSLLEQELRRALTHGFTKAELAEARANLLNHAEQAVKTAPSRESQTIASQLISAIGDARVFTTPETNLELTRQGLETITPEACHQAFKTFWDTPDLSLVLTTKKAGDEERQKLRSLFESSRETPVEAPVEATAGSFAYTDFGQPGTITADEKIADLGARQLTLSNQVRVNLKATDFEKNTIRLFARIGSGQLTMPKDSPGLDQFASAIFEAGGLGKHSADDLQRLLAGKNLSASFGVD
ncbi:MAG: M16 family metallopeptidase, partial [Verrucomicrobiales bacterium]